MLFLEENDRNEFIGCLGDILQSNILEKLAFKKSKETVLTQPYDFFQGWGRKMRDLLLRGKIVSRELIPIGVEMIVLIKNKQDCAK